LTNPFLSIKISVGKADVVSFHYFIISTRVVTVKPTDRTGQQLHLLGGTYCS